MVEKKVTLTQLAARAEALNKELKLNFKSALKEEAKIIFDKWPKLTRFSWTQYAPYFNDGEPCEFRINDLHNYKYGKFEAGADGECGATEWSNTEKDYKDWVSVFKEDAATEFESIEQSEELESDLNDFISSLNPLESTVRAVLDEGEVIVTRKGVTVEEYCHD